MPTDLADLLGEAGVTQLVIARPRHGLLRQVDRPRRSRQGLSDHRDPERIRAVNLERGRWRPRSRGDARRRSAARITGNGRRGVSGRPAARLSTRGEDRADDTSVLARARGGSGRRDVTRARSTAPTVGSCIAAIPSAISSVPAPTPRSPSCCGPANGRSRAHLPTQPLPRRGRSPRCVRCRQRQAHGRAAHRRFRVGRGERLT